MDSKATFVLSEKEYHDQLAMLAMDRGMSCKYMSSLSYNYLYFENDVLFKRLEKKSHNILKCEVKWALGSITTNKASEGD